MGLKMLLGMPVYDSLALTEVIDEKSLDFYKVFYL